MKKVYLETFGCQMNVSDSERALSTLEADGYEVTADESSADIVLLNTCSVREKAEHKLYTRVGQIATSRPEGRPLIGVMGCVAQLEGDTLFKRNSGIDFVLGTKAVGRISKAIGAALDGEPGYVDLDERELDYDWSVSESRRSSPHVAFVPIIEGCNKFCTYCIVPFSRGREKSLAASEIVREVLKLRREGVQEIHLIGQNVNSYRPLTDSGLERFKGATPFARLLRAVAATGMPRIKFTTSFPRDFHADIVDAIEENDNLCNWVHLPVQSGSDRVLKMMRRGHTIDSYLKRIDRIRSSPRGIALSTDIIVGFPSESEEDFQATVRLAEYCRFDSAYIFKYSPRPGTPAYEMEDDVPAEVKTRRFLELEQVQKLNQLSSFQATLGTTLKVLVEGISSRSEDALRGHSTCHRLVNFPGEPESIGKIVDVEITECKTNTLFGKMSETKS
ncbi:MAG: tRNA (N6-isopentenyl adenosine(37)-C2)-methylthiotransferase MiaB [Acidobacteria bacterium]|nr:tRNA (N6-isopentenyl adenosine(37)-C2)-methylthiotransferase MiaB [Acidobacteriota bacterium]